jgi:ABC-type polysaccharide/polyol phosphate export permease
MEQTTNRKVFEEVIRAARLWPIWLRIGLQDIRMRYRRSAVGVGWIFINLAIMIIAVGLIYGNLLGQELREFLPFLTVGLISWGYLTSSIVEGGNAFIASEGYIKQIGLPIYIYVFRFFVSITITMLISLPAYLVVAFIYSVRFKWGALWVLPGIILLSMVSFLSIAIFAHLNARFRDASHIASVGLQVMFFVTPIIWPPDILRKRAMSWIIDFNPFYHLIEVIRRPLTMSESAAFINYLVAAVLIVLLSMVAWLFAKHLSRRIAFLL